MDRINITGERSIDRADAERAGMDRVNAIWNHPVYQEYLLEADHLLLDPEVIYAAAVLHDIGKSLQYEEKIPHEAAGVKIAGEILVSLPEGKRFTEQEKKMILTAIEGHRRLRKDPEPLERLLYESDKASRMCFACPAEGLCDWSEEKKNMEIRV